jgi:phage shock protein PspC (stress-responsive transcriptional regulator)
MEQTHEPITEEIRDRAHQSSELTRPLEGRMLAGVAQGLSNRLGVPAWVIRVAFIVTAFVGGMGVALYIAGWAFIRSEDESETPAERFFSQADTPWNWVGIALIAVAVLIVLGSFSFFSGEVLVAFALLGVGLLIYMGHLSMPGSAGPDAETAGDPSDSKEGVQQMTTTTDDTVIDTSTGDSPAGGDAQPPRPMAPTPPDLPPAAPKEKSILGRVTIGVMLLAMGVLAIVDQVDTVPIDAEPRHYVAMAVTVLGLGLIVGAFIGKARWLIVLGAILVPTMLFSPAFEYDWNSARFDSEVAPISFETLQASYHQDIGNLQIDLTRLDWDGQNISLDATMDFGQIEVIVPADVAVSGQARVEIGRVAGLGQESNGIGDPRITFNHPGTAGSVFLDLDLDVGNIHVRER